MAKIKIGVIPAAGKGERMGHLTLFLPKPLLPLYDKPIICKVIENMILMGVEDIYIITYYHRHYHGEVFRSFLKEIRNSISANIHLIELEKPTSGIAETIYMAKDYINEPFVVILGDDFTVASASQLQRLINTFFEKNAIAVEGVVIENNMEVIKRACCLLLDNDKRIIKIEEKPEKPFSKYRGIGIYIFSKEIFKYIEKTPILPPRNEKEITNTLALVAQDGKAYGEIINAININVNTREDWVQAILISMLYKSYKINELIRC